MKSIVSLENDINRFTYKVKNYLFGVPIKVCIVLRTEKSFLLKKNFFQYSFPHIFSDILTPIEHLYSEIEVELNSTFGIFEYNIKDIVEHSRFSKNTVYLELMIDLDLNSEITGLKEVDYISLKNCNLSKDVFKFCSQ